MKISTFFVLTTDQLIKYMGIRINRKKHGLSIYPALQNVTDKNHLIASPNALVNLIDFVVLLL